MSTTRPSRSAIRSTPLSASSAKRKSGDREDLENRSPNRDEEVAKTKKSRFFSGKTEDTTKKTQSTTSRIRSALPRYNSSAADAKRRYATERITAERVESTPGKPRADISPSRTPSSLSTPSARSNTAISNKRPGRLSISRATRGKIKALFDKVNIQDEDKINELIAPKLKVKCKWDYKDKAKRQTEVINDLKSALKETIQGFKSVQEDCEEAEGRLYDLMNQLQIDLQECQQQNHDLKKSESKLKKDYIRVSNDYNSCRSQLRALEEELGPLRQQDTAKEKEILELKKELHSCLDKIDIMLEELTVAKGELQATRGEKQELTQSFQDLVDEVKTIPLMLWMTSWHMYMAPVSFYA